MLAKKIKTNNKEVQALNQTNEGVIEMSLDETIQGGGRVKDYKNRSDIKEYLEQFQELEVAHSEGRGFLKYKPSSRKEIIDFIKNKTDFRSPQPILKHININLKKHGYKELTEKEEEKIKYQKLDEFGYLKEKKNKKTTKINKKKEKKKEVKKEKVIAFSKPDIEKQAEVFEKIFDTNRNCFIRIRCAATDMIYSYNVSDLKDPIKLFKIFNSNKFSREDLFYSLATYKTMKNGQEDNIFSMHAIPVDIDFKKIRRLKNKTPLEIFELLQKTEFNKTIAIPNIVEIGNQLRLIYNIEAVGATRPSKNLVKRIGRVFAERLADYWGDTPRLTDSARIKGSINTKSNDIIDILFIEEAPIYNVSDLRDKWLDPLPDWYPNWKAKKGDKPKVIRFIPKDKDIWYAINNERIQEFFKIAEYYGKDLDGRRFLCYQVRNHAKLRGDSDEEALKLMLEFNKSLAKPLRIRVIEQDTRNVNRKQYQYKNDTILDYLDITPEEVVKIGLTRLRHKEVVKEEKKERDRERRKAQFRNNEGLTKTQIKRRNEFIKIARLELEDMSINQVAKELGKAQSTLAEKLKKHNEYYQLIKQEVIDGKHDEKEIEHSA